MVDGMNDTDDEPVDRLVAEWQNVRPDLDFGPMALFARSNRFVTGGLRRLDGALADHGLTVGEFDVLSALRRTGEPFSLKPSELAERLMVTRAGITARVDRLEEHGVVARRRDPNDRRSEPIVLTDVGRRLVDSAVVAVLAAEADLFAELTATERSTLDGLLRRLHPLPYRRES
jgi:DNA-binding MarR family transcriptional regulator